MRNFTYQALTKDEELLTGVIAAQSAATALAELEAQGITVLLIRQVDVQDAVPEPASELTVVHDGAGERILRERVTQLIERRATLAPALIAFAEELPKGRARRDLQRLATRLIDGASAAELTKTPDMATTWLPFLGSGTMTDTNRFLQNVFVEAERDNAISTQRWRSLAYPFIVMLLGFGVLVFLSTLVIPTFINIFDDFALDLPKLTRFYISLSQEILYHPLRLASTLTIAWGAIYLLIRFVRSWIKPGSALGVFTNGNSGQLSDMADFLRRLSEALQIGLRTSDALRLAGRGSSCRWLQREAERLANVLETEHAPQIPPHKYSLPATVLYALQADPDDAPNIRLLQELAEVYSGRIYNRFDWATGFTPQLAVVIVGLFVGGVVFALYLPLVSLINGLTG
ncbi:MAG: hypothetical protein SH868_16650 [Bythopirellula sp.]|nr:hypothetical protein [Bythopirellula sp.]